MADTLLVDPLQHLELLREVLALLPVGIRITDGEGRVVYGNPAARTIWAGVRPVGIDRPRKDWQAGDGTGIEAESAAAERAILTGTPSVNEEIEVECADGSRKIVLSSAIPLPAAGGGIAGAVLVDHDITERKRREERLRAIADHDALTGAYNRRFLNAFLAEEMERCRRYRTPLAVIMFDLDHFKNVNDAHGHQAGDTVLRGIAECVLRELRGADVLARYGGEEFVIVAPGIARRQAEALAERLRARIAAERFEGLPRVTCSFGVCEFNGGDADSLIARVDELMYEAKRKGRNCVVAEGSSPNA